MKNSVFLIGFCWLTIVFTGLAQSLTNKYRLVWDHQPATSITIGWCTNTPQRAELFFGLQDHDRRYYDYTQSRVADTSYVYKGMIHQFVRLTELYPDTAYYFVIRDPDGVSRRFWFRTAPDRPDSFTLIAGGDSRNNRTARQKANRMVAKLRPLFVGFGGDFTSWDTGGEWADWLNDWQETITEDRRLFPLVVVRGNHERSNEVVRNLFFLRSDNIHYGISIGGQQLRYTVLNTEIVPNGHQLEWLKRELSLHTGSRFKIMQYHRPIRPHVSRKKDLNSLAKFWAPLFFRHQVDLVVECDAHTVKRTWPIRPSKPGGNMTLFNIIDEEGSEEGFVRDDTKGTVYVGEGCWGAPLRTPDDAKVWTRDIGMFNQFKWIHVTPKEMTVRCIQTDLVNKSGTVTEEDLMRLPKNLPVWSPSNGAVIHLPARR